MKMRFAVRWICALSFPLFFACGETGTSVPVSLTWGEEGYNELTECYENVFVIKNISGKPLEGDWTIYFSQLPRKITNIETDKIKIEVVNAGFFKMYPTDNFDGMGAGDSMVVRYGVNQKVPNVSQEPEGFYWVWTTGGKESKPISINLEIMPQSDSLAAIYSSPDKIYGFNSLLNMQPALIKQVDVLPSVKRLEEKDGMMDVPTTFSLSYSDELTNEADILKEKLASLYNIKVSDTAEAGIKLNLLKENPTSENSEWYRLDISTSEITVESATCHGIFNGVQTLLSLMKGREHPEKLQCLTITDYPDLHYRGFMLDIARNFTTAENVKKLIDILSSYKVNVLHLHFCDDEGWRIEIPGLEELTEVASKRGHTSDESANLFPGYDGWYDPYANTSGNGYYSRAEFIDLIRYAAKRHVRVLPEIESPSHSRAAIVAMKARYERYIKTDEQKARKYLLSEAEDTSVYVSAQAYTDNAMNVSLPSTYRFMEKVITEIKNMYDEAGVELPSIHIGGDEVPSGAWEGSPSCRTFMKENGVNSIRELAEYFSVRIASYMMQLGIKFDGWQEVALRNSPETDKQLASYADGIYCWNTVPEWGGDEIPYHLANKGYPIVLCNVNNFYVDLAYSPHYMEQGHSWAGYVDESKSFSMLPFSLYRSSRATIAGDPIDLDNAGNGKEVLKPENRSNIKGVQAQLFTETIRGFDRVEYYIFPKIFGLVERGWNAHPVWEQMRGEQEAEYFYNDLSRFYSLISLKEMPYLSSQSVNFRLPNPGLMSDAGYLYANTSITGATIHYTTDGKEPDENSMTWTEPVKLESHKVIKACIFYLGKKSLTTTLII